MKIIAHRGNSNHNFSENSINALLFSLNNKDIVGIECDVRITKDKKLVLIHDAIIDFISDGYGIVKYLTLNELRKYKYGKSKESIATLNEFLERVDSNKIILIELKEFGNDYVSLVDETIKLIQNYSNLNIYVCSFNNYLLNYLKDNYHNIKIGIIIGYGLNKMYLNNNFDFNIINYKYLDKISNLKETFLFNLTHLEKDFFKDNIYIISDKIHLQN